jgi:hypothetical protein
VIVRRKQEEEPRGGCELSERSRPEPPPTPAAPSAQPVVVSTPSSEALPPAPPDPAPRPEAESVLPSPPPSLDPLTPVQALPPLAEVGPREARPAILRAPAGPTPKAVPSPATSPAKAGPALVLTAEQKARLDALPEATANLVLTWLLSADRILVAEARKKLAPPPRRPEAPRTLPEVLGRIREDPSFPSLAADWLASSLQDRKSYSGFKARCEEAWRGDLPVSRLVSAYEQASGPKAKNPGAIFMYAVRRRE